MEHQLWKAILAIARIFDKTPHPTRHAYRDVDMAAVFHWAVVHDRPGAWACAKRPWPIHLRRRPLPSPATLSRRLRRPSVVTL